MTRRQSPLQQLKEAKQPTNTLIGRRSSPSSIRALVCKVANFH